MFFFFFFPVKIVILLSSSLVLQFFWIHHFSTVNIWDSIRYLKKSQQREKLLEEVGCFISVPLKNPKLCISALRIKKKICYLRKSREEERKRTSSWGKKCQKNHFFFFFSLVWNPILLLKINVPEELNSFRKTFSCAGKKRVLLGQEIHCLHSLSDWAFHLHFLSVIYQNVS